MALTILFRQESAVTRLAERGSCFTGRNGIIFDVADTGDMV